MSCLWVWRIVEGSAVGVGWVARDGEQVQSRPLFNISCASPPSDKPGECVRDVVFVPDGVAGAQANPLGNGAVLLLRLGELLLRAESLVALFCGGG